MRSSNFAFEQLPEFDRHEMVVFFSEPSVSLKGFISLHNTRLGPAIGGTRMMEYSSHQDALRDALQLSKAMSYKCALAGVKFGGGKSVIIGGYREKNMAMMRAYGKIITRLCGMFRTGCDVGINNDDVAQMARETHYVAGYATPIKKRLQTGDMAALGVFYGIQACLTRVRGTDCLNNVSVAIKGLGKLGSELARLLAREGARLIVADIDLKKINKLKKEIPALSVVDPAKIYKHKVDVYAPCALGGDFNKRTVGQLNASIIAGGANNQLVDDLAGDLIYNAGILYAPDYVINGGGLINVVDEDEVGGYSQYRVLDRVRKIGNTLTDIFEKSKKDKLSPHRVTDILAEKIIYGTQ